jgi:hypothetical protein
MPTKPTLIETLDIVFNEAPPFHFLYCFPYLQNQVQNTLVETLGHCIQ